MTIIFEKFDSQSGHQFGYCSVKGEIHIDSSLSNEKKKEVLIHEVLESLFSSQFKHSFIEIVTSKIYLALKILEKRVKEERNG